MQLFEAKTFCSRHFCSPCGYSCCFSLECTHWMVTVCLVCAGHCTPGTTMHSHCSEFAGSSVQFSRSVVSDSLRPHGLQYTRPPCPASTQVWVSSYSCPLNLDAIQPSHPLSSPSPAFNLSQHEGLFQWVSSSNQVAKVLELQLQHQNFQWIFRTDFL